MVRFLREKEKTMRLLLLLALCASTPALAADQFDLACQGTKISQRGGAPEPNSFRLRVDLAAKKWCADACAKVLDVSAVKPDRIVLADDIVYNTRSDFSNSIYLDPKTYAYHQLTSEDRTDVSYLKVEAACTVQPFTPLP
jgi:hypothetical protein